MCHHQRPYPAWQVFAPRQMLLRCPTTVHPWTYAKPALPPSVVVGCGYRAPMDGPSLINLGRVSVSCFRFMPVVNNGFSHIHWHRDMNYVSPPKTRRRPIRGGSNPASMRDTVFGGDTQPMPLIFVEQLWLYPFK